MSRTAAHGSRPTGATTPAPARGWNRQFTGPQQVLAAFITLYSLTFFLLAKRCFDVFGYNSCETAGANNLLWWMVHGHPYRFSTIGTMSYLQFHAEFIWLLLTPIYALVPGVYTLLLLQSAALGLTAWPVYLIVRRLWANEVAAVLMGVAFVFMPSIASGNLNQIHPVPYLPVFLLFATYYFLEQRFAPFIVFAGLMCLVRENAAISAGMFGLWAWTERRPWKWRLTPLVGGAAYLFVAVKIIIPWALQGQPWRPSSYFSYLGTTPGTIISHAITQPGLVLDHLFSGENIQYFIFLVQPLAWVLPFGHWAVLLALPDLALNLLADNNGMKVIGWHYQFLTTTGLFLGAVFTIRRLLDWLNRREQGIGYAPVLATGLVALCLSHWVLWLQPQSFEQLPYADALEGALASVPPDKSVILPDRLTGHVSSRERYDRLDRFRRQPDYAAQFEYVILDANERQYPPPITQEFFEKFQKSQDYQLIFSEKNVFVFHRRNGESDWKILPQGP